MPIYIQTDTDEALLKAMSMAKNSEFMSSITTGPTEDYDTSVIRAQNSIAAYEGEPGGPWFKTPGEASEYIENTKKVQSDHRGKPWDAKPAVEREETNEGFRERSIHNYNEELSLEMEREQATDDVRQLGCIISDASALSPSINFTADTMKLVSLTAFIALGHPKE